MPLAVHVEVSPRAVPSLGSLRDPLARSTPVFSLRWWRRKRGPRKVGYPRVRFDVIGGSVVPREWGAAGHAGPLEWTASLERSGDGVAWSLAVTGTLTGAERRSGRAANPYAAGDECKAALREVIDEHNAFVDVTG